MPVLVIEPAAHTRQSAAFVDPLPATYLPAPHAVHDASVDAVEYLPAAHVVHVVAPAIGPLFVIDPAGHAIHGESVDAAEYLPAAHAVQLVALALAPVSVIEPAWQSLQYDCAAEPWNWPGGHAVQLVEPSASANSPAMHTPHDDAVEAVEYLPAAH